MYSQTRMYTDDTSLTFASADVKHIKDGLNYHLKNVYTSLWANKLTLNFYKNWVYTYCIPDKAEITEIIAIDHCRKYHNIP